MRIVLFTEPLDQSESVPDDDTEEEDELVSDALLVDRDLEAEVFGFEFRGRFDDQLGSIEKEEIDDSVSCAGDCTALRLLRNAAVVV